MTTDEEMIEWFKKRYPAYAHMASNIELVRRLYAKEHNRGVVVNGAIEKIKIVDAKNYVKKRVKIEGIASSVDIRSYTGCPKCYRKECDCGVEKVKLQFFSIEVGDDTGFIRVTTYPREKLEYDIKVGDVLVCDGVIKEYGKTIEMTAYGIEIVDVRGKLVDEVLNTLVEFGEMNLKAFLGILRSKGISFDDVKDRLEQREEGGETWVSIKREVK